MYIILTLWLAIMHMLDGNVVECVVVLTTSRGL
jgi:hypothetical protein